MRKRIVVTVVLAFLVAVSSVHAQTTDFFRLVQTGMPQDVQAAISNGADVNARDLLDLSPLMDAAWENSNPEVITVLVKAGADVNAHGGMSDWSVLMWAAIYNPNSEMITALLKAGADISARDSGGTTALMHAASNNENPDVITTLLRAGADAKAKDNSGRTALDSAQRNEKLKDTDAFRQLEKASK